jgi:CubicO group peptidase (beta-lactamase class C family)
MAVVGVSGECGARASVVNPTEARVTAVTAKSHQVDAGGCVDPRVYEIGGAGTAIASTRREVLLPMTSSKSVILSARLPRIGRPMNAVFGLSCILALASCSANASDEHSPASALSTDPRGVDSGTADGATSTPGSDGGAPVPPCDEKETAALQATIDGAHSAKTDMVAAIKTPSCGVRYFTSGPSKLDAAKLHRTGSVAKTYTGGVILELVEAGLVSLEDPASKWLAGIPGGDRIHVRHLLQHVSGLAATTLDATRQVTPAELLSNSFKQGLQFEPGSKFAYRNVNFVALGVIAEKVTGKALAALVRERLSAPLGLTATFFEGGETVAGDVVAPRTAQGSPGKNAGLGGPFPNSGCQTSARLYCFEL